jgi:hypothetical protein
VTEQVDQTTGEIVEVGRQLLPNGHEPKPTDKPWEFINRIPDKAEVLGLLASLPEQWGVKPLDFAEHVQPISQPQKILDIHAPKGAPDRYQWVTKLYMSVAGRIQMLNKAWEVNKWSRVEFVPEPQTSTGSAGLLMPLDGKAVYRVILRIFNREGDEIGSRPGMASRTGSSLFEKAETAAHGRAVAAWGIGVLPGSGVASLDEMQTSERDRPAEQDTAKPGQKAPDRDELRIQVASLSEDIRRRRHMTDKEAAAAELTWLVDRGGQKQVVVWDEEEQRIRWEDVPTQVLGRMKLAMEETLGRERAGDALG